MRLPRVLQPKWKLFLKHHERLTTRPDPLAARQKFLRRIAASRRIGFFRTLFFAGLYFSFIAGAAGFLLAYLNIAAETVVGILSAVASSLTIVFLAGIFVCTRYLNYLEVDLYYYSVEEHVDPRPQ